MNAIILALSLLAGSPSVPSAPESSVDSHESLSWEATVSCSSEDCDAPSDARVVVPATPDMSISLASIRTER